MVKRYWIKTTIGDFLHDFFSLYPLFVFFYSLRIYNNKHQLVREQKDDFESRNNIEKDNLNLTKLFFALIIWKTYS